MLKKNQQKSSPVEEEAITSLEEFKRIYFPKPSDALENTPTDPYEFGANAARQSLVLISKSAMKLHEQNR